MGRSRERRDQQAADRHLEQMNHGHGYGWRLADGVWEIVKIWAIVALISAPFAIIAICRA